MTPLVLAAALLAQPGIPASTERTISLPPAGIIPGHTVDVVSGGVTDLVLSEEKSEGTLSFAWASRRQWTDSDNRQVDVVQSAFNAKLTVPFGGTDNLLSRESFDGLDDGLQLSLSWTSFGVTRARDPFDTEHNSGLAQATRDAVANCLSRVQAGTAGDFTAEQCQRRAPIGGPLRPERDFLRTFSTLSRPALNRLMLSQVIGYGFEGSVGLKRFSYRTPLTLAEHDDTEVQFSVKAYGLLFPRDGVSMLSGSVEYDNGYEAQDEQVLCRAVVVNPDDDCVHARGGPPNHVEKLRFELEYRRTFDVPALGRFGIAPRFAFDALSNDYEAAFPIYFAPRGTDRILPGLSVSYDSRHDEMVFGLFLRTTFSFGG
jgi:hypothetical protein